jgi:hypothetical protein
VSILPLDWAGILNWSKSRRAAQVQGSLSPGIDLAQGFGEGIFGFGGVVVGLEADPETVGHCEESRQAKAGVGGDRALAGHDFTDAPLRDGNLLGEAILGNSHGFEEFLEENFTGMRVGDFAHELLLLYRLWFFENLLYSPLCKLFEFGAVAVDERIFLRMGPTLQLRFSADGFFFGGKKFLVDECDGTAGSGARCGCSFVVAIYSLFEVGRVADVERIVGAAEDVYEK